VTVEYVGAGAFASGTGALTVALPAAATSGDLLLLAVESANEAITAPSGWTELGQVGTGTAAAAAAVRLGLFWRWYAAGSVTVADTGDHTTARITAWRGCDPTGPISGSPATRVDSSNTTTLTTPTVTVPANGIAVHAVGIDRDAATTDTELNAVTGATLVGSNTVTAGRGGGVGLLYSSAGQHTQASGFDTSLRHAYVSVALAAAPDLLVGSGVVDYPTGATSASFALTLPAPVSAGDWVLACVTSAASDLTSITTPTGAVTVLPLTSTPDGNLSGAVFAVQVPDPKPATLTWTWPTAQRGSLAWIAATGVAGVEAVGDSGWIAAGPTSKAAPSITVPAGAYVAGVVMQPSGSATLTPPVGWTQRTDATERDGHISTRGVQADAGPTGTATWTVAAALAHRLLQIALTPAGSGGSSVEATLVSDPYPATTGDVADGAAIVRNPDSPADSVVITTSKAVGGGLYVLDLAGHILSSNLDGAANSVDWRDLTGVTGWDDRLLVATVDRDNNRLRYYWLNRTTKLLTAAGWTALGYEPYGSCLLLTEGAVSMVVTDRGSDDFGDHTIRWYPLSRTGDTVTAGSVSRTITADGVMEGLAGDDQTGAIYVSREDHGLYRYDPGSSTPATIDTVAGNLVADVEDVALARRGQTWLVVSSQGDSSFHLYADGDHRQRITLTRPGGGAITGTDGLDWTLDPLGPTWPNGLLVVHDSSLDPSRFAYINPGLLDIPPAGGSIATTIATAPGTGRKLAAASTPTTATATALGAGQKRTTAATIAGGSAATTGVGLKRTAAGSTPSTTASTTSAGGKQATGATTTTGTATATGAGSKRAAGGQPATSTATAAGVGHPVTTGSGGSTADATATALGAGTKLTSSAAAATTTASTTAAGRKLALGGTPGTATASSIGQGVMVESGTGGSLATSSASGLGAGRKTTTGGQPTTTSAAPIGAGRKAALSTGGVAAIAALALASGLKRTGAGSLATATATTVGVGGSTAGWRDLTIRISPPIRATITATDPGPRLVAAEPVRTLLTAADPQPRFTATEPARSHITATERTPA